MTVRFTTNHDELRGMFDTRVARLVATMRARYEQNFRQGNGWQRDAPALLLKSLRLHVDHMDSISQLLPSARESLVALTPEGRAELRRHCADVANLAWMLADRLGALEE